MKLFHTSDWHLGRMLYGRSLLQDQQWFLEQVFLPAVERERPACVLIAGDIYDRQIAPTEAIRLFDATLSRLMSLGTKVCVISGNHDGAGRMALLKQALRRSGVYFATELSHALTPVLLEEGGERLQLFLLPYFDTAQAREFLGDGSLRGEGPCMERLLEQLLPLFDPEAGHVLLSHCFAAGAQTSDSESTLFVGGSGQVPPSLFDPFDYPEPGVMDMELLQKDPHRLHAGTGKIQGVEFIVQPVKLGRLKIPRKQEFLPGKVFLHLLPKLRRAGLGQQGHEPQFHRGAQEDQLPDIVQVDFRNKGALPWPYPDEPLRRKAGKGGPHRRPGNGKPFRQLLLPELLAGGEGQVQDFLAEGAVNGFRGRHQPTSPGISPRRAVLQTVTA